MYLAPELLTGQLSADHLSDLYSLGLVFYELLTLQQPVEATTREGILREVIAKQLRPVSWHNPGVPKDLERLVHKACSKDPDERYQSAKDFAEDLKSVIAGRKIQVPAYRYGLDEREIAAERPGDILAVVFTFQFFAILSVVLGGIVIARQAGSLPLGSPSFNMITASSLATCFWFYAVARGLLAGRKIAWGVALLTCLVGSIAGVLYFLYFNIGLGFPVVMSSSSRIILALLSSSPAMLVVLALFRRRTRQWFRLAEELRAEHSKHIARFSLRLPRSRAKVKPVAGLEE